jgi:AraC-like DNA-binding protein
MDHEPRPPMTVWCHPRLPSVRVVRVERRDRPWVGTSEGFGVAAVLRGAFEAWYRGRTTTHRAGTIKLKEPGEIQRDLRVHAAFSLQIALFPVAAVAVAADALGLPGKVQFAAQPEAPRATIDAVFAMHAALADPATPGPELDERVTAGLTAVVATCGEGRAAPPIDRRSRAVRRAYDAIRADLTVAIALDELAAHAGVDKYRLVRAFRAEVGVPPYEFLTQLRVARAANLLGRGRTVADVAASVGLYDESQLHRHFRRIVGVTPGRFSRAVAAPRARRRILQDRPSAAPRPAASSAP